MAELILSPVADLIIETLGSAVVKKIGELYNVSDDLEQLEGTLSTIRAVLLDAERQQNHNNQVRLWLQRLEDVVSDADNLVDEVATEGFRRQLNKEAWKKVRLFFSSSNQLVIRSKLAGEIKRLRTRLGAISADMRNFKLEESREEIARPVRIGRETHSFVVEKDVVGRIDDKKRVLEKVMEIKDIEDRVIVISIFGMGGLGKTTLAQLVFNDESLVGRFDVKSWVCVSDNFDEKVIVGLIVKSMDGTSTIRLDDSTMEDLQKTLREKMNGKRYLLVLDDVWNENHEKWQKLMGLLSNCGECGSRIIVTTRSERIARITSNIAQPFRLGILDPEESWLLFKKIAFMREREPIESDTMEIGKKIVKKCGGNPLAIRMIASLLFFRDPKTEWPSFLEKELSSLSQQDSDVLPTLKLTYDSLPSHLKQCFSCCRLYPKDYRIDVQSLIDLWEAQGLISVPSNGRQGSKERGYDYFIELFWRCLFQEGTTDEHNKVKTCKMHDLVHDLAIQVAGNKYAIIEPSYQENTCGKAVHVSYGSSSKGLPTTLLQARRLRSLFRPTNDYYQFGKLDIEIVVSNFKFLRMLDLHNSDIEVVPNSIGKLKYLRYLDLSYNAIKRLPSSITKLANLQTLKLNNCYRLRELPRDMKKLINLRHLEFSGLSYHPLYVPRGISQMSNLQTLSYFALSDDAAISLRSSKLDELMRLGSLRGKLEIRGLKSGIETSCAILKEKEHLQFVSLIWSRNSGNDQQPETTLEGLQPHPNLKELSVEGYDGVRFSNWISSLTNLVELRLEDCLNLKHLPSLDSLHYLKKMSLYSCPALEYIITDSKGDGCSRITKYVSVLPSLRRLELKHLENFRGWQRSNSTSNSHQPPQFTSYFPSLTYLVIKSCSKLTSMPFYPNVVERLELEKANRKPFEQSATMRLTWPHESETTTSTSFYPFLRVKNLHLSFCIRSDLQLFPAWMQGLSSLKKLVISEDKRPQVEECQVMDYYGSEALKWIVEESNKLELLGKGHKVTWEIFSGIRELALEGAPILKYLAIATQYLISLEILEIVDYEDVVLSSMGIDDTINWKSLRCLHSMVFSRLPKLIFLPEWLRRITTLERLVFRKCDSLTDIPDSICELSSLQRLEISTCHKIESLPESIRSLTLLQELYIYDCPNLHQRYKIQDWHKIKHIPDIRLEDEFGPARNRRNRFCSIYEQDWHTIKHIPDIRLKDEFRPARNRRNQLCSIYELQNVAEISPGRTGTRLRRLFRLSKHIFRTQNKSRRSSSYSRPKPAFTASSRRTEFFRYREYGV